MNKTTAFAVAGALIVGVMAGWIFSPSPSAHDHASTSAVAQADSPDEPSIWTCSMHPQIQQPGPGACPICGMDLIPLIDDSDDNEGPRTLSMSESSRALADITTTVVERRLPIAEVHLVGKLDYDETRLRSLTARFPARIDELFVNFTGVPVKARDHLARIYSPELLTAQQELLTAHAADPDSIFTRIAREKLRLWDLLPAQIDALIANNTPGEEFELRAPLGGVVITKNVKEGDYVKTGEPLFRIADLSVLWLHLDAFESNLAWLRFGQEVSFRVEAYPGEVFRGKIAFIAPEVDRRTRTTAIRVNVPNPDGRLKPGMFATGRVEALLTGNGDVAVPELAGKWISPMHPEVVMDGPGQCTVCGMDLVPAAEMGYAKPGDEEAPLLVPASAVLRTGLRAVIYVALPDRDRPTFEGREIVLGPKAGQVYIVRSGLTEGERVVTHGAFKIDSALQILAKPSMMNPEGGGPVPGHNHGGVTATVTTPAGGSGSDSLMLAPDLAAQVMPAYFDLHAALAADNLPAAREALSAMMQVTGHQGALPDLIHPLLAADDLDNIRRPHFETISNALIAAVRADPTAFTGDVVLMHCPMVYEDRGADWLQSDETLLNPYFGAMMLTCGNMRENLTATDESDHSGHAH